MPSASRHERGRLGVVSPSPASSTHGGGRPSLCSRCRCKSLFLAALSCLALLAQPGTAFSVDEGLYVELLKVPSTCAALDLTTVNISLPTSNLTLRDLNTNADGGARTRYRTPKKLVGFFWEHIFWERNNRYYLLSLADAKCPDGLSLIHI